jgi:excisionase family DNA binding protein
MHESKPPVNEDQILTIKEIAAILKLAEKTVYSMAQDGELPAFKVRGQWRMRRTDFDNWCEPACNSDQVRGEIGVQN